MYYVRCIPHHLSKHLNRVPSLCVIMDPILSTLMDKFEIYMDELDRGYPSLARVYQTLTGEEYVSDTKQSPVDIVLKKFVGSTTCYIPSFSNAVRSVHYMHEMAVSVTYTITLAIRNANLWQFAVSDELEFGSGKGHPIIKESAKKDVYRRADEWMLIAQNANYRSGVIVNITTKIKTILVDKMKDVKYFGEVDAKDLKKFIDTNKDLNCKK